VSGVQCRQGFPAGAEHGGTRADGQGWSCGPAGEQTHDSSYLGPVRAARPLDLPAVRTRCWRTRSKRPRFWRTWFAPAGWWKTSRWRRP
jgi:hypothetical protein